MKLFVVSKQESNISNADWVEYVYHLVSVLSIGLALICRSGLTACDTLEYGMMFFQHCRSLKTETLVMTQTYETDHTQSYSRCFVVHHRKDRDLGY